MLYSNDNGGSRIHLFLEGLSFWKGLPDSLEGGHAALGLVLLSHLGASLVLAPNMHEGGCQLSLPLLGSVVVLVGILFVRRVRYHTKRVNGRVHILSRRRENRINRLIEVVVRWFHCVVDHHDPPLMHPIPSRLDAWLLIFESPSPL